jgi:hypothetical protein
MIKLKSQIKFIKKSKLKIKIKRIRYKLEEIKNQDYASNNKIKNKLKLDKKTKNQTLKIKILRANMKCHKIR